jgi:thioredoxin reductase
MASTAFSDITAFYRSTFSRGRDEVRLHGGVIVEGRVTKAECVADGHFSVTVGNDDSASASQTFDARRLLLATGLRDVNHDLPGFSEFYGLSVFHCPDCDGYEVSDKRVAVLGAGRKAVAFTLGLLTWTDRLALITDGGEEEIGDEDRERLAMFDIPILDRSVVGLEGDADAGRLERVRFADGDAIECDALFFNLGAFPASNLHETLGCRLDRESELVWVDAGQQTSVLGVYAAGDITPHSQLAVVAAAEGAIAAVHIHKSLIPDARRA